MPARPKPLLPLLVTFGQVVKDVLGQRPAEPVAAHEGPDVLVRSELPSKVYWHLHGLWRMGLNWCLRVDLGWDVACRILEDWAEATLACLAVSYACCCSCI